MQKAIVHLKSAAPLYMGKQHGVEKKKKESPSDYEKRTYLSKMHVNEDGEIFIPNMMLKNCLSEAAKYLSIKIPGKGHATYTKHFVAGVDVLNSVSLGIKIEDVKKEERFVPSNGQRGGPKRVMKTFPFILEWEAKGIEFRIWDDTITEDIFRQVLEEAGKFIGIGSFRPINNGYCGRFFVESVKYEDLRA